MSEDAKINNVIEKYSDFFKNYNADVGHTLSGVWFFMEYDEQYDDYYSFIRFKTAEELEHLITGLLADDLLCIVETSTENINYSIKSFDIQDLPVTNYDESVIKLSKSIDVLNRELRENAEKVNAISEALLSITGK